MTIAHLRNIMLGENSNDCMYRRKLAAVIFAT